MFDFCFASLPSDFPNGVATSDKNVATFVATLNSKTLGFSDIVATLQPPDNMGGQMRGKPLHLTPL
jgi:hypothetical protein